MKAIRVFGRSKALKSLTAAMMMMFVGSAMAAGQSIGALSATWGAQANQLQTFAVLAAGAIGFAMVVYGIYKATYGAKDDQQVKVGQMIMIALAGALMVASVTMTTVFQDTFGINGDSETGALDKYQDARP